MKEILTDVSVGARSGASTVVDEGRGSMVADKSEVVLDGALARGSISAKQGRVPGRAARDTLKVRAGFISIGLGTGNGGVEL